MWHDRRYRSFALSLSFPLFRTPTHSFVRVTWRMTRSCVTSHVTHSYVQRDGWHNSFICVIWFVTWLIHTCDITGATLTWSLCLFLSHFPLSLTYLYVWYNAWHDSFVCVSVTWLIHTCDTTGANGHMICLTLSFSRFLSHTHSLIHMCDTTRANGQMIFLSLCFSLSLSVSPFLTLTTYS